MSTFCLQCSEGVDLSALRQQILTGGRTANEKAEGSLLERKVNDLSRDEWRELIAGIPTDVKKEIVRLKEAGKQGFALMDSYTCTHLETLLMSLCFVHHGWFACCM